MDRHDHHGRPGEQAFGNGAGTGGKTDGTLTDMGPKPRPRNAPRAAPPWGAEPADLGPRTRNGGGGMADFSRFSRPTQAFGNGAGTGQKGVFTTIGKK
jgi:hypothetical protein